MFQKMKSLPNISLPIANLVIVSIFGRARGDLTQGELMENSVYHKFLYV